MNAEDTIEFPGLVAVEGSQWTILFPDLPGCATFADSEEELMTQAQEAMLGWLVVSLSRGEKIPRSKARLQGLPIEYSRWLTVSIPRARLASELLEELQKRRRSPQAGKT